MPTIIENPGAYYAARERRIKQNARTTRSRRFRKTIADDSAEFKRWLLGGSIREFMSEADVERLDAGTMPEDDPAWSEAQDAHRAWRKSFGWPPDWLTTALDEWGGLTERQLEVARKMFREREERASGRDAAEAERRANAPEWEAGRQEITGEVKSIRYEEYGNVYNAGGAWKGLILLPDGRKLWSTIPRRLIPSLGEPVDDLKGRTVTFKVTVEPSKDDPTMGFGKRPR